VAQNLFPQCPATGMPSRAILVVQSQGDAYATLTLPQQTVYAMTCNLACQWRTNLCVHCMGIQVAHARPWREFQNVHVTACTGPPCNSIAAPRLLIVYKLFTKVAQQFCCDKSWHLGKFFRTFQNSCHDMVCTISRDLQPHASPCALSRLLPSLARQIVCHGVNCLSCWGQACL